MNIGLLGVVGIVFLVLKLCSVIAWSWWWVLLPFYAIPAGFLIMFLSGLILVGAAKRSHKKQMVIMEKKAAERQAEYEKEEAERSIEREKFRNSPEEVERRKKEASKKTYYCVRTGKYIEY